jgi:hypothetical protein
MVPLRVYPLFQNSDHGNIVGDSGRGGGEGKKKEEKLSDQKKLRKADVAYSGRVVDKKTNAGSH